MVSTSAELIRMIRKGRLSKVITILDAGVPVEINDGQGDPGLPMGIACFMGHADIVRELGLRGARVNFTNNRDPASPLSMALRAGKSEVVKVLIELGVEIPPDVNTGLSEEELSVAKWKAQHFGVVTNAEGNNKLPVFEQVEMVGCAGTSTSILDEEMRRAIAEMDKE